MYSVFSRVRQRGQASPHKCEARSGELTFLLEIANKNESKSILKIVTHYFSIDQPIDSLTKRFSS